MNCVLMNFLFPIFLLIPMFAQKISDSQLIACKRVFTRWQVSRYNLSGFFAFMIFASVEMQFQVLQYQEKVKIYLHCKYIPMKYGTTDYGKSTYQQ